MREGGSENAEHAAERAKRLDRVGAALGCLGVGIPRLELLGLDTSVFRQLLDPRDRAIDGAIKVANNLVLSGDLLALIIRHLGGHFLDAKRVRHAIAAGHAGAGRVGCRKRHQDTMLRRK